MVKSRPCVTTPAPGWSCSPGRTTVPSAGHRGPPFRRAALSFMHWQVNRGVLASLEGTPPGSPWWRAVNQRLLRDGCEAVARSGGLGGTPSSPAIELWMSFVSGPTARTWYRAHNASIAAAYVEHRDLADGESRPERFFLNVVLLRVLYAHALVAAPRLALGRLAALGPLLGDPRLSMTGIFLLLSGSFPPVIRSRTRSLRTSPPNATSVRSSTTDSSGRGCSISTSGQPRNSANLRSWTAFVTVARRTRVPLLIARCGIRLALLARSVRSCASCRRINRNATLRQLCAIVGTCNRCTRPRAASTVCSAWPMPGMPG